MTDPKPTLAAVVGSALEQLWREELRLAEELHEINKAVLFDALRAAGIDTVTVLFDGYADSGQIESTEARAGLETVSLPATRVELARISRQGAGIARVASTVQEAIETLVYDCLNRLHSGWEMNDGAYGEFVFDVAERTIGLDYNERYTSSERHTHRL